MTASSNVVLGRLAALTIIACVFAGYTLSKRESAQKAGLELTYEQYVADYEDHKAKVTKEVSFPQVTMVVIAKFCFLIGLYEFLSKRFRLLAERIYGPDPPADSSEPSDGLSYSYIEANLYALPVAVGSAAFLFVVFLFIWGPGAVEPGVDELAQPISSIPKGLMLIPIFILSVVLHEILHGIGFVKFGRISWSDVEFGVKWKVMTPYASCKVAIPVPAYRMAGLLPGLVLGGIPVLYGLLFGVFSVYLYGIFMTIAACGDILIVWLIKNLDRDTLVLDHPDRVGCKIIEQDALASV
jgi:hypothetical protein